MVAAGSDAPGYIRGGGGAEIKPGLLAALVAVAAVVALGAVAVAVALSYAQHNSDVSRMRSAVAVRATVTGCVGVSSGVGQDIQYWDCRAGFTLSGRAYDEPLRGSRTDLPVGRTVSALATPGEPPVLSLPHAVGSMESYWLPAVLGGLAAAGCAVLCALGVRARRSRA